MQVFTFFLALALFGGKLRHHVLAAPAQQQQQEKRADGSNSVIVARTPRPQAHVAVTGPPVHIGNQAQNMIGSLASDLKLLCEAQRCNEMLLPLTWVPQRPTASSGNRLVTKELKVWYQGAWTDYYIFNALVELLGQTFNATIFGGAARNKNCWKQPYTADDGSAAEMDMCETGQYLHAQYDADPAEEALRKSQNKRPSNFLRIGLGYVDSNRYGQNISCEWTASGMTDGIAAFKKLLKAAGLSRPNNVNSRCCQDTERCVQLPLP